MVVNVIKWRPWGLLQFKKFEATILVRCLNGSHEIVAGLSGLTVEIKWKGSKSNGLRSLKKKSVKRNSTREEVVGENGVVLWDEEFKSVCAFCGLKEGEFHPWNVVFVIFHASDKQSKKRVPFAGPAELNLAEFASFDGVKELVIDVPLVGSRSNLSLSLNVSVSLLKLRAIQESSGTAQRAIMLAPLSPCFGGPLLIKKEERSALKSNLRKVKSFTDYVSSRKSKKADNVEVSSDSKFSSGSENSDCNYPFDTDSLDDSDEGESEESKGDSDVQNSCAYGTLVHANLAGGAFNSRLHCEDDDLVYYSNRKPEVSVCSVALDSAALASERLPKQSPKLGISIWSKRKLSFKSSKVKGEPLLKKDYGEEGGDDIDFDRRQLSSSDESSFGLSGESTSNQSSISKFGDDIFAVGSWERKEIVNRDGSMKLQTQVFLASIDQRSESAAGESACTALVAVFADWLLSNQGEMPIKSEFDSLIREGSLQWRNLCENEDYKERFPDKHFDLETVLQAKIRPLSVVPKKSYIGFFHPEMFGLEVEGFGFLDDSMSFDKIWNEIAQEASSHSSTSDPLVYIVSWNDHFFILRVDSDAYYIIDTLGERLYEGCNQAYVLKFDKDTTIERVPDQKNDKNVIPKPNPDPNSSSKEIPTCSQLSSEKSEPGLADETTDTHNPGELSDDAKEVSVVCKGKESCKEYIKSFLAAIPIRELQVDMKRGLMEPTLLHQRLQIEFSYTSRFTDSSTLAIDSQTPETTAAAPEATDFFPTTADCTAPETEASLSATTEFLPSEIEYDGSEPAANVPAMVALAVA